VFDVGRAGVPEVVMGGRPVVERVVVRQSVDGPRRIVLLFLRQFVLSVRSGSGESLDGVGFDR